MVITDPKKIRDPLSDVIAALADHIAELREEQESMADSKANSTAFSFGGRARH